MRIISGKYKSRRIEVPKNLKARPTTDFAKENLFNVLANQIDFEGLSVADLYAGTGSIAFEFLSRGVEHVDCVELNDYQIRFIHKTRTLLNIENLKTFRYPVEKFIKKSTKAYDIIFADPPYQLNGVELLPEKILGSHILKADGMLIFEHSGKFSFRHLISFKESRAYGSVHFSFFKK